MENTESRRTVTIPAKRVIAGKITMPGLFIPRNILSIAAKTPKARKDIIALIKVARRFLFRVFVLLNLGLTRPRCRAEEILEEIGKDSIFYDESDGGVTFSGGEPLMQLELLQTLLTECKNRGIHTALDTSGYDVSNALFDLSDSIDLVLFDLKIMDSHEHKQYTGVPNEPILKNLEMLSKRRTTINVRIPIIPGVTDDLENITEIGKLLSSLPSIQKISLLPYHDAWLHKCVKLGRKKQGPNWPTPSETNIAKIHKKLQEFGLKVERGKA